MLAPPVRSKYLMNDIPRGTTVEKILRSLAPPVHTDPQLNYDLIQRMLENEPVFRDSELDDSLSVTTIEFKDTPEWLRFLNGISYGFPLKTRFGTIWGAVDMTGKDTHGRTAFIRAVMAGDLKYAEMLAEYAEADVTSPDERGRTALHWACEKQLPELINLCLAVSSLDSGMRDKDNLTAFDISCRAEDETIPALFYKNIFELEKTNPDDALLRLLTVSSEPDEGLEFPGEALFGPILGNKLPLVEALMKSGVNLTATNNNQETALHLAAKHGHAEIVSTLLENSSRGSRVDAEAVGKDGLTALHYAAQQGHVQAVKVLLNLGADKEAKDSNGQTARDRATGNDDIRAALDLESDDQTTLHRAAAEGRTERVQQLLDWGAVLEGTNRQGMTALHCAAGSGHTETVKLLLDRGAELEAGDISGQTVLHRAAGNGHTETVKLLLDRGAELEVGDGSGRTALHRASETGHTETVKLLLDRSQAGSKRRLWEDSTAPCAGVGTFDDSDFSG